MRAVCYIRTIPEATSEAQERAFRDVCALAKLTAGDIYTDEADAVGALEFRRMLREASNDPDRADVVVIATLEVLGPTARDQARRALQVDALKLKLRIADGTEPDDAVLAAWQGRDTRERRREQVRAGMRDRALRGEVLGRAPYGYRAVDRHLAIDSNEARVVREIFRRYLDEGEGVRVIARYLNDTGIETRRGGAWSMVSVRGVLRNPVYIGTYRRLGVVVATEHESLVTRARFYAAQERLAARRTSAGPQQRGDYLLSGLATCGYCGNRLIGVRRTRRARSADDAPTVYSYYQCESRTNQSRCAYHTRRTGELEAIVRERIEQGPPPGGGDGAPSELAEEEVARLETKRLGLRRRLDALLERRASGEWSALRLRQEAAGVALEDLEVEDRIEAIARRQELVRDEATRAATLIDARARLLDEWDALPFDEHRALLRDVVSGIVVTDEDVRVDFAR